MAKIHYDFSGWATRNDLRCSDGRTIRKDAFIDNDGTVVPLVWQHNHNDVSQVLGHAYLENRPEGVYAYGVFNNNDRGNEARELVRNGDINALSIFANNLKQNRYKDVLHGSIKEVSLVLAGANPGAYIDNVSMAHSDDYEFNDEEAVIYTGLTLEHSEEGGYMDNYIDDEELDNDEYDEELDDEEYDEDDEDEELDDEEYDDEEYDDEEDLEHSDKSDLTVRDVFDTLTDIQKTAVYAVIGAAVNGKTNNNEEYEEDEEMKHNAFDTYEEDGNVLSHADFEDLEYKAISDIGSYGSLRKSILAHAQGDYGIENIDWLFPDAKELNTPPDFIKRETEWVRTVMSGTKHVPFSRIKTTHADITADEARAKGYIKGNQKTEEIFTLLKRQTTPQTIYKKQKLDRDDIIDITDFDVVLWMRGEMRIMLDEEIARAILIGDGRNPSSPDKIKPDCIRPIALDTEGAEVLPAGKGAGLYAMNVDTVYANNSTRDQRCDLMLESVLLSRKDYRGSGDLTMFTTDDVLTSFLLQKDGIGHRLYKDEAAVAQAFRVKRIVTVPVMENFTITDSDNVVHFLDAIIVDLHDYAVGADKGGEVNSFSDFDIDVNQEKYLIETRCSGALIKPKSAFVVRHTIAGTAIVDPGTVVSAG